MPADSIRSMESNSDSRNEANLQEMLSTSPANTSFMLPSMDGSPPKVVTLDEVKHVLKNIQNMTLAHEIALNPEFKLQPYEPPPDSLERRIKDTLHKAFWDLLRAQLEETPPRYDHAIQLLADIKECFPQILTLHNKRALNFINEVLDDAVIKQQVERGTFDFKSYADFVIQILAKSCAPARDESLKRLTAIEDVVDTCRGILELMTDMKLDMANYLLDVSRNDFMNHSVEYEKKKFQEYLEYYKLGFPDTEHWLQRNRGAGAATGSDAIYNAYMELMDWNTAGEVNFPEVLSMDKERILKLGQNAKRLCLCASLISIAQALPIISQRGENRTALAKQIGILLQDVNNDDKAIEEAVKNVHAHMCKFINEALAKEQAAPMNETVGAQLKQHVLQIANKASPVRALMWKRLVAFVRYALHPLPQQAPPDLPGYSDYQDEVATFVHSFKRVISYNHSVFGDYFMELLAKKNGAISAGAASVSAIIGDSKAAVAASTSKAAAEAAAPAPTTTPE